MLALIGALAAMLVGAPAQALAQELAVSDATVAAEGTGTNSSATFTITRSAPSASEVTVSYATASATAVSPGDFAPLGLTPLTFGPGETTKQVVVSVVGDALDEADETFSLQLSAPSGATIGDGIGVATIVDDDPEPVLSVADASVSEGGANLVFNVTLTPVSGKTVTVDYATTDGTATSTGAFDYTTRTGTLTFAPGVTTRTVSVPITQDTLDESDETLQLNLSLPAGSPATIADALGSGTIIDDDGPTISVDDRTVAAEGATGTTQTVTFTISLSTTSVQPVTVGYKTTNGTAVEPADYVAVALTAVTFAPGETTKTIAVTVNGDAIDEVDETFKLELSVPAAGTPMNATILDPFGLATIVDDDPVVSVLSVSDPTVVEGTAPTSRSLVFTVTLTPASGKTVTVNYATADGTAVSTTDYTARTSTLTFSPGVTTLTVSVTLANDSIDELDETLFLDLTLPVDSPATITKARGTGTIVDDDGPTIAVNDITVLEGDSATTNATFTITLSAISVQPVSLKVVTANVMANDTAVAPADYTAIPAATPVTIAAGQMTTTVTVVVKGDIVDEPDERFSLTLSEPVGGTLLSDVTGLATILDDDDAPAMSIADATVKEGSVGNTTVVLTVSLDRPSDRAIGVGYASADVSATAGVDYGESSDQLIFSAGQTQRTIPIPIGADGAVENDETFTVTLTTPSNATLAKGVSTVTITDDDLTPGTTPSLSIADVSVRDEGDSGFKPVTVTVRLSSATGRAVGVSYATADSSALAPADYEATSGRLEFAVGETTRTFEVAVKGDEVVEGTHSFKLNLSEPSNATIDDGSATVTISDDDVGLGAIEAPASVNASKVFCARRKGCTGLALTWTALTRGTLVFELTALAPRKTKANPNGIRVISVLKTSSTVTKPRTSRKVLRPTPGIRTRRLFRRLRTLKADALRLKVTFTNRSGEAESRTVRVKLNLRR